MSIGSGFGAATTTADIIADIDLAGKIAIVNRMEFRTRSGNHARFTQLVQRLSFKREIIKRQ